MFIYFFVFFRSLGFTLSFFVLPVKMLTNNLNLIKKWELSVAQIMSLFGAELSFLIHLFLRVQPALLQTVHVYTVKKHEYIWQNFVFVSQMCSLTKVSW